MSPEQTSASNTFLSNNKVNNNALHLLDRTCRETNTTSMTTCQEESRSLVDPSISVVNGSNYSSTDNRTCFPSYDKSSNFSELTFTSKGLHFCNLNIQHILPKIDELRILMTYDKCPDIFGLC